MDLMRLFLFFFFFSSFFKCARSLALMQLKTIIKEAQLGKKEFSFFLLLFFFGSQEEGELSPPNFSEVSVNFEGAITKEIGYLKKHRIIWLIAGILLGQSKVRWHQGRQTKFPLQDFIPQRSVKEFFLEKEPKVQVSVRAPRKKKNGKDLGSFSR